MLVHRSPILGRALTLFALGGLWAVGCGGSAVFTAGGDAGAAAAGANSTGAGGGGAGSPHCTGACSTIGCGPGYHSFKLVDACCATCVPDGQGGAAAGGAAAGGAAAGGAAAGGAAAGGAGGQCQVLCVAANCAKGSKLRTLPGSCCPTCVPELNACSNGQAGYDELRKMLLAQDGVLSCLTTSDCVPLTSYAYCGDTCSNIPIAKSTAAAIEPQLSAWASAECSTCTPEYPPCPAPLPPACIAGQCTTGTLGAP